MVRRKLQTKSLKTIGFMQGFHGSCQLNSGFARHQGNLLKGIDKNTVRRAGIEPKYIKRSLFSYLLIFS